MSLAVYYILGLHGSYSTESQLNIEVTIIQNKSLSSDRVLSILGELIMNSTSVLNAFLVHTVSMKGRYHL